MKKDRKQQKKEEAQKRAVNRAKLSAEQQLKILDRRLGKNQGAKKERKRLLLKV